MSSDLSLHWSAYPALLMAGAFALGIGIDANWAPLSVWGWMGGASAGLLGFAAVQWWDRRRMVTLAPLGRLLCVGLLVVGAGGAGHAAYDATHPRALTPIVETSTEPIRVRGTVADAPERTSEAIRFTLEVAAVLGRPDTATVRGRVRVTLQPSPWADVQGRFPQLREGDRLRLRGTLQRPPGQRNPGGFDYAAYLARRGVCCTMYVGRPADVTVLGARRGVLGATVVTVRQHIRRVLARYVPSADGRAVLRALLLGDRSRISEAQETHFARTGLMHLLAVSGLHVFLVGMVLYVLLRPFLMRFRLGWRTVEVTRAALTILVLGGYMLLTGARPSVVRAVVMATFVIGGVLLQRSPRSLNTLGVAALVLMAARPPALFDVGFQLSMAAVAGIVTLNPRFLGWIPEDYRSTTPAKWMWSTITTSAAAILATAPVLFYHFGWVSAAGLLLNIVGIPCTGLALSAAIAAVVVAPVWSLGAGGFGSAADLFVRGLLETTAQGASWLGWAGLRMPEPKVWVLGALAAAVLSIAQWSRPRLRWRCIACGLLFAVGAVWIPVLFRGDPTMDVIFFGVGQGDSVLITGPEDRRLLVDTGPRSPDGSAAAYTILPYLRQRGVEHLETVVITHPDEDHLGGLPAILRELSVGRVLHSGQRADTDLYEESRALLEKKGTRSRSVDRGDQFQVGGSIVAQVLGPPRRPVRWGIENENGASVVLHLAYGRTDVLLPGDVERAAEQGLAQAYGDQLAAHVVKVPHHGSETSSTPAFVEAATDESVHTRVVVSVGADNRYGMPDSTVLSRWQSHADTSYSTAATGAVWLRSDGASVQDVEWQ